MKRIFIAFFSAFLPWVVMLMKDELGKAAAALILQTTVIGWPVATIWAWRTAYPPKAKRKNKNDHQDPAE